MSNDYGYQAFKTDISHVRGREFENKVSSWINGHTMYKAIPNKDAASNAFNHTDMDLISSDGLIYPIDIKAVKHTFTERHYVNGKYAEKVDFNDEDWRTLPLEFATDRGYNGWMYAWKKNVNHTLVFHTRYQGRNGLLTVFTNDLFNYAYPKFKAYMATCKGMFPRQNKQCYGKVYERQLRDGTNTKAKLMNVHVDDVMRNCKSANFCVVNSL